MLKAPRCFRPLFEDAIAKHNVPRGQLHAARRSRPGPMKGQSNRVSAGRSWRHLFAQPASHVQRQSVLREGHFKTLKYQPRFPQRFGEHSRARQELLPQVLRLVRLNRDHHHCRDRFDDAGSGARLSAGWTLFHVARQVALDRAFAEHPARFVNNKAPVPFAKPTATWINRPAPKAVTECRPSHSGRGELNVSIRRGNLPHAIDSRSDRRVDP